MLPPVEGSRWRFRRRLRHIQFCRHAMGWFCGHSGHVLSGRLEPAAHWARVDLGQVDAQLTRW